MIASGSGTTSGCGSFRDNSGLLSTEIGHIIVGRNTTLIGALNEKPGDSAEHMYYGWIIDPAINNGYPIFNKQPNVVVGDANSDGSVSFSDITVMYAHITNVTTLDGIGLLAADMNTDGEITFSDISLLYSSIINN